MKHVVQYLKLFQSVVVKNRFKTKLNIAMININTSWLIMIIYLKTANNSSVAFSRHPVHGVQAIQVAHSPHLFVNYADVLSPHTFFGVYDKICCFFVFVE